MKKSPSGLTIGGFVLSIVGVLICTLGFLPGSYGFIFPFIGLGLSVLSLIFGIVGAARRDGGLAVATIVISIIGFLGNAFILWVLFVIIGVIIGIVEGVTSSSALILVLI